MNSLNKLVNENFCCCGTFGRGAAIFFVDWVLFCIFGEINRIAYEAELEAWNDDISSACGAGWCG